MLDTQNYAAQSAAIALSLPTFDLHNVEAALKVNHHIFGGQELSESQIEQAISNYRYFLAHHKSAGMPDQFEVPTYLVDRVWHTHMCETRQYEEDCLSFFGKMFHHSSGMCNGGLGGPD